jgi:hypothetical protein
VRGDAHQKAGVANALEIVVRAVDLALLVEAVGDLAVMGNADAAGGA